MEERMVIGKSGNVFVDTVGASVYALAVDR